MRAIKCFLILILIACTSVFRGQTIKVISAKDKSSVPFAYVEIKSAALSFQQITDLAGKFELKEGIIDSVEYVIKIKSIGYKEFKKNVLGINLKALNEFFLLVEDIDLSEVVVTAQYQPTLAEKSVQNVKIIDKDKIKQMGAVNLRDVLTNQLNVRLQQDNILGSNMNLQGISGENVKILIDGVPLIGRLNGSIDLTQINMNNVERIEIIEGPLSVQYGTNALAGTINIITKKGTLNSQMASINSYYESIGTYNLVADLSFTHKSHQLLLSGGRNYFDGWNSTDNQFDLPKSRIADSLRFKQWKPKEQYFANLTYRYFIKKMILAFKSDYFNEKVINRGFPKPPYAESTFDDTYYTRRIDNNINISGNTSENWSINSINSFNYYQRTKKTVYKDLTTLNEFLSSPSDQDTSSFTLLMSRASFYRNKNSALINYELGYDFNYESALGKRIENKIQTMGDYALFATAECKPIANFIIKPGIRYTYNTNYTSPLIPSLNLKWNTNTNHIFRASYGRGFRAPTIKELYFYFVDINHNIIGNENLKAERSHNFSLSYNFKKSFKKFIYRLDLRGFYNDIDNLITLAQVNSIEYSYVNIGVYKTTGLQVGNNFNYKNLVAQIGINYTGRYNQLSETESIPVFNYSPEFQSNVSYKIKTIGIVTSLFYKYNGVLPSYNLDNGVVTQSFLSDYHMLDITVSKTLLKECIHLTFGCKNLLNVTNISANLATGVHSGGGNNNVALATGRNYFISISYQFKTKPKDEKIN